MKRFLIKISIFLLCFCVVSVALLWFTFSVAAPQFETSYVGAFEDKINRLNSIQEPKIILVGNSNLAFGMDSAMLEEATGMPVVNLGGHGGLGNAFQTNMAKFNIGQGDIVIVCHTNYDAYGISDPALAWITIENRPEYLSLIPKEEYFDMLKALPSYVGKTLFAYFTGTGNEPIEGFYSRDAFNEYGDIYYSRTQTTYAFNESNGKVPGISEKDVGLVNDLNAFCKERGAVCLVAGYPIAYGTFTDSAEEFEKFQNELDAQLDCEIISDFTDYFMDTSYFYDTQYHLTDEGVQVRTQLLIDDISKWQENSKASE
ncbi:MAG: hypothetical protein IJZ94_06125 [Clostridia bacterium]|nr:hypothetical protein [Clostridia bacterium]